MKDYLSKVKKPNYISDELIKTIDMIAQARDNELAFDKTIIAEIISLNNAITGEYYVSYQQGKFKAYAPTSLSFVYQEGANVYVKIPGGDFSAKKLIEGRAYSDSKIDEFLSPEDEKIVEMVIPFEDKNEYSILAYAQPGTQYYEKVIYENNTEYLNESFKNNFLSYPKIKISADFKTNFKGSFQAGNFGLLVEFYTENADGTQNLDRTYTRRLDRQNFFGSLDSYQSYSPQYALYQIDNVTFTNIKKITFFQEQFKNYDTVYDSYGEIISVNDYNPNIFIKNIKISLCAISNDEDDLYQIYIKPKGDLTLEQDSSRVQLEGMLYYLNRDILDAESCTCYWFKQNPEITQGHELFNTYGGVGWEEITDPELIDFNILTMRGIDVYQKLNIKLVIVYKNSINFDAQITLRKKANSRFAIIKTEDEKGPILKLLDGSTAGIHEVFWYALLEDGTYEQCNYTSALEIDINNYMRYSKVYFQTVITLEDKITKVPYDYTLTNDLLLGGVNVVFSGPDTFLYDVNGNISYEEEITDLILTPSITYGEGVVEKSVYWVGPGEVNILQVSYSYDYSMLTNMFVDSQNRLHFKIKNRFDSSRNVNTVKLVVETTSGEVYYFNKNINFVKEGSQGTNGLTYTMIVEQCNAEGKTIEDGIQPMIYNTLTQSWDSIYLQLHVRENGREIYNNQKIHVNGEQTGSYSIEYKYEPINIKVESFKDNICKITKEGAPKEAEQGQYFIRLSAEIKINDAKGENKNNITIISLYYPILIGVGQLKPELFQLNNLPKEIIYNTSGEPSYNDNAISVLYNGQSLTSLSVPQSLNKNIYIQEFTSYWGNANGERAYRIYPASSYKGAYFPTGAEGDKTMTPMGAIKITLTSFIAETYIIQPVVMLLSTELNQKIQGYNGAQVTVPDENNLEKTKDVNSALGMGKIDPDFGTFCDGLIIGTESVTNKSGIYLVDENSNPTNTIKNDGSINLSNGIITSNKDKDGNMIFSILGLFTIKVDKQGYPSLTFEDMFKNQIRDFIKSENGETQ